jgi:hypothetical protein
MSETVYRICNALEQVLVGVPLGTNLGLFHLFFVLLSGRFLPARGAVFTALADFGLPKEAVRRAEAALCYGKWKTETLLKNWQAFVSREGRFVPSVYEGYRPVACDLTGFLRPQLQNHPGKHYVAEAGKAVPAIVIGIAAGVGRVGKSRLALPRLLVRWEPRDKSEFAVQKHLLRQTAKTLVKDEVLVTAAGFRLVDLLTLEVSFVTRLPKNFTARRSTLPTYAGKGRRPQFGERVRPLPGVYGGKGIPATPPDAAASWHEGGRTLRAEIWNALVLRDEKPGATVFVVVAIYDRRYNEPWLLATNLSVSAEAVWRLYRDRWAVEQLPLAAKPMLGAERAFVFGKESRLRLPELALLGGNILSYIAASSAPVASGFWDRAARPTCGRLRRALWRLHFSDLPTLSGQVRKKNSVTAHLTTGVRAHRRSKTPKTVQAVPIAA